MGRATGGVSRAFVWVLLIFAPGVAGADTGAAFLLRSTVTQQEGAALNGPGAPDGAPGAAALGRIQLTDPFQMQLFSAWQMAPSSGQVPPELDRWIVQILSGNSAEALQSGNAPLARVPAVLKHPVQAARLYALWKAALPGLMVEGWLTALADPEFRKDRVAAALGQTVVSAGLDRWLQNEAILLDARAAATARALDGTQGLADAYLTGWASLKRGSEALKVLDRLPPASPLKVPLAQTAALAAVRENRIPDAAKVLKEHLEPALAGAGDSGGLSVHYLQIARLLYQVGQMEGAEQFYLKVPNGRPEFMAAREELAWARLRMGDLERLRGELTSLDSGVFEHHFLPEVLVVRAISNLKLCYYPEVEEDFAKFIGLQRRWAGRIREALSTAAAGEVPAPPSPDFFAQLADRAVSRRELEVARVRELKLDAAVVTQAEAQLAAARQDRAAQYLRQWRSLQASLHEAIRKMRFVKVEYLSQTQPGPGSDSIRLTQAAPERPTLGKGSVDGKLVFPHDGVYWPDELFRLRSAARGKCLDRRAAAPAPGSTGSGGTEG